MFNSSWPALTFLKYNCISQVGRGTLLIICQSIFILLDYHLLVDWINQPNLLSEKNLSLFLKFKLTFRFFWNIWQISEHFENNQKVSNLLLQLKWIFIFRIFKIIFFFFSWLVLVWWFLPVSVCLLCPFWFLFHFILNIFFFFSLSAFWIWKQLYIHLNLIKYLCKNNCN